MESFYNKSYFSIRHMQIKQKDVALLTSATFGGNEKSTVETYPGL